MPKAILCLRHRFAICLFAVVILFWMVDVTITQAETAVTPTISNASSTNPIKASSVITADDHNQPTISVKGLNTSVTLAMIQAGLPATATNFLQNQGNGVWQLNANLLIGQSVTLSLTTQSGVNTLHLRSQPSRAGTSNIRAASNPDTGDVAQIDYASFVYLRTNDGTITIDGIKISSWDVQANAVDQDVTNGRAYLLAKYAATLNINNTELSYLGSADGESYGVAWRDINDPNEPNALRTRVTGTVRNSQFHHNYYGVYTFQASNMLFQGNQFHDNVRYGFDPHDFSHDILVENNQSYNNGAHGFIISRGCYNFVFRHNKAYANHDSSGNLAHGFMLDSGSPNSSTPPAPSTDNLLDQNEAYGNEGYGLRILNGNNNQVLNNNFHQNQQGIVVDVNSTANTISGNVLGQNSGVGLTVRETADGTQITHNQINENGDNGLYLRSNNNWVSQNTVNQNQKAGIALLPATGFSALQGNQILTNTITHNGSNGLDLRNTQKTELRANLVQSNLENGIYLTDNASATLISHNDVSINSGAGIRSNGAQTIANTWTENQLYANAAGGILVLSGANQNIAPPNLLNLRGHTVSGTAPPLATVEIFADADAQGHFFAGRTSAAADGQFSFTTTTDWPAANVTAVAIDAKGNASGFGVRAIPYPLYLPLLRR